MKTSTGCLASVSLSEIHNYFVNINTMLKFVSGINHTSLLKSWFTPNKQAELLLQMVVFLFNVYNRSSYRDRDSNPRLFDTKPWRYPTYATEKLKSSEVYQLIES